jgi:hypothetical protein
MWNCANCGKENQGSSDFCWNCTTVKGEMLPQEKPPVEEILENQVVTAPPIVASSETTQSQTNLLNSNGNVEESLLAWGKGFLVVGIVVGLICIWAAGVITKEYSFQTWGENGISWYIVLVGVGIALQGMFIQVLLKGGAEIIRLLRKLNNK